MKTDDLVALLANSGSAVEPNAVQLRFSTALGWGAFATVLLMAIGLGVRRDIAEAALLPMFWAKLALPAGVLAGALLAATRLSRPGVRVGRVWWWLAAPVLGMWLLGALALLGAEPAAHDRLIYGVSAEVCPFYIAGLSVPAFAAVWWAMRGLAPTRALWAGAAAGLTAGAMGALAYALYCPEMAAPFLGIWYLCGMLIPAAVGAFLGPWLLRW
jgi:hypothetical protein